MNKTIVNNIDKNNMYDIIKDSYKHIRHSFDIIESSKINYNIEINNIIICGMGGSAIGGDFVKTILFKKINIPIFINREYFLPKWVQKDTLVIICSYSGNTEETISCLNQTEKLNLKPIIISSGGNILNRAIDKNYSFVKLPSGIQPRAAFGYLSSLLLLLLNKIGVVEKKIINNLYSSINEIKKMSTIYSSINDDNKAIQLSSKIFNKYPVIYGTSLTDVVSLRLRCQLAENTKILSSHFIVPEQNHNEIEGFEKSFDKDYVLIWIYDLDDEPENIKRMKITSKLLSDSIQEQYFFTEDDSSLIIRLFKLIYFFDWVSFYGAIHNNVNPTTVNKIVKLKSLMK